MSIPIKPHWTDSIPGVLFLAALVVGGGVFVYALGAVFRFLSPFVS